MYASFESNHSKLKIDSGQPNKLKIIKRYGTALFGKSMLNEAINILPHLPDTDSLDEIRSFLRANLHFNAEQTRQRYANYIIKRMFPFGYADKPLRLFAKAYPGSQYLKDACFYRFMLVEPLVSELIEELFMPNISEGSIPRERIRNYLKDKYPSSNSITECNQAFIDTLKSGGIAAADAKNVSFALRDIHIKSFAFILHSEFPEPGMYNIKELEENRYVKAMLWNPGQIVNALYELRNLGLFNKISEIDGIRQFTTKHTLSGTVEFLIGGN